MSFWSVQTWIDAHHKKNIITPFDRSNFDDAKYPLSIGNEIFVTNTEKDSNIRTLTDQDGSFTIGPGQFAFILTSETICIPFNAIGFITIRTKTKFSGLVNISGFHVDPGYHGKLIFAVFNAGPTRIELRKGDAIFSLWIADFDGEVAKKEKAGLESIPSEFVTKISGPFTTPYQLLDRIDELREEVLQLKAFRTHAYIILAAASVLLFALLKDQFAATFLP